MLPTFRRNPLLLEFLLLGLGVALAHYWASATGLYYSVGATDSVMHFAGGLWIGLGAILCFFTSGIVCLPRRDLRVVSVVTLAAVLVIGLGWEVHELWVGLADPVADRLDTAADLVFDFLGGLAALGYFRAAVAPDERDA